MHTALLAARLLLASVFALASTAKLADLAGSRAAVASFGIPVRLAGAIGTMLPVAELAVSVALLTSGGARFAALAACALLAVFAVAIIRSIARGEAPDCHCFGRLHSERAGAGTLARDLLLGGVAGFVATAGWHGAGPSAIGWIGRLSGSGLVAFVAGIVFTVLALATAGGWSALLRQHGRLLLRIDELEARLDAVGVPPAAAPALGLRIGMPAPAFTLSGLDDGVVTLESLTAPGLPVLLVFTDPRCGPCNALMPHISGWQRERSEKLKVAVLTRGNADVVRTTVREHAIESVWMDDRLDVYNAYQARGTPSAVLVDGHGRIASAIVAGTEAITGLAEVALERMPANQQIAVVPAAGDPRSPAPAHLGLPIGADAPTFELTGLDGQSLALVDADRDTLVPFWNPGCGFCQRMLEDVRALARSPRGPRALLIASGTADENRVLGIEAPIVLDPDFTVATAFDSHGTPSGVLVDRDGRVGSRVAVGAAAVLALAGEQAGAVTGRAGDIGVIQR